MAEIPVRVEVRAELPVAVRGLPALERLVYAAPKVHGVAASEATMRQDGPDLVLGYSLTVKETSDDDA